MDQEKKKNRRIERLQELERQKRLKAEAYTASTSVVYSESKSPGRPRSGDSARTLLRRKLELQKEYDEFVEAFSQRSSLSNERVRIILREIMHDELVRLVFSQVPVTPLGSVFF